MSLSHPCEKLLFELHMCLGYGEVNVQVLQIEYCSLCSGDSLNLHTKSVLKRDKRIMKLLKERLTGCVKLGFWHQFNFKRHL